MKIHPQAAKGHLIVGSALILLSLAIATGQVVYSLWRTA